MNQSPRVVACMPTWNGERFVEKTLASLAAQTYGNLHVLMSDDCSTDRTADICQTRASSDSRFRLIRQSTRRGWLGNLNFLLDSARGDYAFVASHDDPVAPTYVERLLEALESHPSAVLAFSDARTASGTASYTELDGVTSRVERARRLVRRRVHSCLPYRGLFRLDVVRRVGGLRRHLAGEYQADHPWMIRLALQGEFVRVPEPLIWKEYHEDSLSASWSRNRTARQATGVLLAAAGEIRRAGLPLRERLPLYGAVCRFGLWALRERHVF